MSLKVGRTAVETQTLRAGNVTQLQPEKQPLHWWLNSSSSDTKHLAQLHVFLTRAMRATGQAIVGFTCVDAGGRIHERPCWFIHQPKFPFNLEGAGARRWEEFKDGERLGGGEREPLITWLWGYCEGNNSLLSLIPGTCWISDALAKIGRTLS